MAQRLALLLLGLVALGDPEGQFAIFAALVINFCSAATAGVLLPLLLKRMRVDPAVAGTVVVTAVTDIMGFFSFLGLATAIMLR